MRLGRGWAAPKLWRLLAVDGLNDTFGWARNAAKVSEGFTESLCRHLFHEDQLQRCLNAWLLVAFAEGAAGGG